MTLDRRGHCPDCPPCFASHGAAHCPACTSGSRPVAVADVLDDVLDVIDEHTPNLTDEDEEKMIKEWVECDEPNFPTYRTCSCGLALDGFYQYQDHLKDQIKKAMTV